jgi:hypothetical protein
MRIKTILYTTGLTLFVIAGCSDERLGGNTTQTENTLARMLVDSVLPEWNRPSQATTIATIRLTESNFDFSKIDSAGNDLVVEKDSGQPIPFEVVYWNKREMLGRLEVRIDSSLRHPGSHINLRRKLSSISPSDPAKVWQGLPDSQKLAVGSVLVDDFEGGSDTTRLPTSPRWAFFASESAEIVSKRLKTSDGTHPGNVFSMDYKTTNRWYVVIKTPLVKGSKQRSLRSMDSIVFYTKGTKGSGMFTALEHLDVFKAWKLDTLDTNWRRICIRPSDFMQPGISEQSNRGWVAVRDSVTHLTFILNNGTKFFLDNIRIYGIDQEDLK